jgi:zinc D-Ala-D-Ala dipeptidase
MRLFKNLTKVITVMLLSLTISEGQLFAENAKAPAPWTDTEVSEKISQNVLYLPIADKAVKSIPIEDTEEPLVDLQEINNPRIKPLSSISSKYPNTYEGYSKLRKGLYEKLIVMLNHLPKDIGIAYYEGFRPLSKQKEYFDNKLKETLLTIKDKERAYQETSKSVSPFIDNVPTHCTGAAIDITLFKIAKGKPDALLDMGEFDTIYGPNNQQETFSINTTPIERKNRLMLLTAAVQAGFVNYGYEWWHYSFGDRAWAYVKGEKSAKYGLAIDKNDPIFSIKKADYLEQF